MKIVDEKVWWEFVCTCCGSTCQAEPEDAVLSLDPDNEGGVVSHMIAVNCGKCGMPHRVPFEKLTPKIQGIAHSRR